MVREKSARSAGYVEFIAGATREKNFSRAATGVEKLFLNSRAKNAT
jgi:hypothetical protein